MTLRLMVQIVERINSIVLLSLFALLLGWLLIDKSAELETFLLFMIVPFIFSYFSRRIVVHWFIKRTAYPGVLYSALDKLGLTFNLGVDLNDELMNDLHRPEYSTEQFLTDNDLDTFGLFMQDTLILGKQMIAWDQVIDWYVIPESGHMLEDIAVEYYGRHRINTYGHFNFNQLRVRRIDILLLLAHFKGKYGQPPEIVE